MLRTDLIGTWKNRPKQQKRRSDAIRCKIAAETVGCTVSSDIYAGGSTIFLRKDGVAIDRTTSWSSMLEILDRRGAEIPAQYKEYVE